MAGSNGLAILPQYQGSYYDLQRQQALAQALMQGAMTPPTQPTTVGSGGSQNYQVMPKMSIAAALSPLVQGLMSARVAQGVGQGLNNLGAQQGAAFGVGAPAQSQQPDPNQQALAQGAASGSVGPTNANAATATALAQQPSQQSPQQGGNASPMNPLGLPPALAYAAFSADPGAYFTAQAAAFKPADVVAQIRAAGIDPNSALGHQLAQQALAKANYIAPTSVRPGGGILDPATGQIQTMPAPAPEGFQNIKGADGNWYTVQVAGGPQAVASSSAAKAGGKAQYEIEPGFQNGKPVNTTAYNIANGLPPPGQQGAPGAAPNGAGGFAGYQAPNGAPVSPSLPPGAPQLAEGAAASFNGLRSQAANTPVAIDGFNKAEQVLLSGVQTGPGSTLGTNILGRLNTAGIPIAQGDTTGYQSLQKFLSNANAQAASAGGYNGSDARFEAFSHGQPNAETMNPQALRYAIQYVRGQQAGVQAKYQAAQSFINSQGGGTLNYPQFEAQWNKAYNPDVMMVRAMPNPADQQAYLSQLKQQGKLGDWMKSYQQMQSMGAW